MKLLKILLFLNLFFAITSCSESKIKYSGIVIDQSNIGNIDTSSKIKLIENFGQPSFIDPIENKYFYYSEKTKEKNFFSKKSEYSYIFVFSFDDNDNVIEKKVLDLKTTQENYISRMKTENNIIKRGLIEKIFGGVGTQRVPDKN